MKVRLQRPRSCLGWFGWVAGILIAFVLFSNVYAQMRLYIARTQAEALARELGYEPKDLLRFRTNINNVNIISGSAKCDAEILFVTPLELDEFEAKLMQAIPEAWRLNTTPDKVQYWWYLPLDTYDANGNKVEDKDSLPLVLKRSWLLTSSQSPSTGLVELYQTEQIPMVLKNGERPIVDNIAVVRWRAGHYPIWVMYN